MFKILLYFSFTTLTTEAMISISSFVAHSTIFILHFPAYKPLVLLIFPLIDLSCTSLLLLASLAVRVILAMKEDLVHYSS